MRTQTEALTGRIMRLEFSYRRYFIKLLSYPVDGGWIAQFEARRAVNDKMAVYRVTDKLKVTCSTLPEANELASRLAMAWVHQRDWPLRPREPASFS